MMANIYKRDILFLGMRKRNKEKDRIYSKRYYQKNRAREKEKRRLRRFKQRLGMEEKEYRQFLQRGCENCGIEKPLVIHHKDRNIKNNRKENFMVLCRNCHWNVHHP